MAKFKTITKFKPCSCYETEKFEQWLEDMAAEGFILYRCGTEAEFAKFEIAEPQKIKYILAPKPSDYVLSEYRSILASYGFTKCDAYGAFEIHKSSSPDAKNIKHNKRFSEICLQLENKKKKKTKITVSIASAILFLLLTSSLFVLKFGNILTVAAVIFWLGLLFEHIKTTKRTPKTDDDFLSGMDSEANKWKKGSQKRKAWFIISLIFTLAFIVLIDIGEYTLQKTYPTGGQNPPFATAEDLENNLDTDFLTNEYREWNSFIAPVCYKWEEIAAIIKQDGSKERFSLDIEYYETAAPWIAKKITLEYNIIGKLSSFFVTTPLGTPDLNIDYAKTFFNFKGEQILIMQNGNKVMHINFNTLTDYEEISDEWLEIIVDYMK